MGVTSDQMRAFGDELEGYLLYPDVTSLHGLAIRLKQVGDWMDRETNKVTGKPRRRYNGHLLIDDELCKFTVCQDCGAADATLDNPCTGNVAKPDDREEVDVSFVEVDEEIEFCERENAKRKETKRILAERAVVEAGGDVSLMHIPTGESISVHNASENDLLIYPPAKRQMDLENPPPYNPPTPEDRRRAAIIAGRQTGKTATQTRIMEESNTRVIAESMESWYQKYPDFATWLRDHGGAK